MSLRIEKEKLLARVTKAFVEKDFNKFLHLLQSYEKIIEKVYDLEVYGNECEEVNDEIQLNFGNIVFNEKQTKAISSMRDVWMDIAKIEILNDIEREIYDSLSKSSQKVIWKYLDLKKEAISVRNNK